MKRISIFIIVASMLLALMPLTGCGEALVYEDASSYVAGAQEYTGSITEIEIDWTAGEVNIVPGDSESLFIEEDVDTTDESLMVHSMLKDGKLSIKYCQSGTLFSGGSKRLDIIVPSGMKVDKFSVDVTSADVNIYDISARKFELESTSGSSSLSIDAEEVEIEHTSGEVTIATNAKDIEIESTSGNTTILVPVETGFTATISKTSGSFNSLIPLVNSGDTYTYLDGGTTIKVNSTSGDTRIELIGEQTMDWE